jgi:hypothetical protein
VSTTFKLLGSRAPDQDASNWENEAHRTMTSAPAAGGGDGDAELVDVLEDDNEIAKFIADTEAAWDAAEEVGGDRWAVRDSFRKLNPGKRREAAGSGRNKPHQTEAGEKQSRPIREYG